MKTQTSNTPTAATGLDARKLTLLGRINDGGTEMALIINKDSDRDALKKMEADGFVKIEDSKERKGRKVVHITAKGKKALGHKLESESHAEVGSAEHAAARTAKAHAAPKKPKKEGGERTLDWAFRRLRRQAVNFFGGDDAEKRSKLREELDRITSGYALLADQFGGHTSKTWLEFMESFFAHEIHPGARGPLK